MMRILHISDLHFGPPFVPKVGDALLHSAALLQPDVVVVSGDLTQRAKPDQFEAAKNFLEQLPRVPKLIVPGNHDVPMYRFLERLLSPHSLYRKYICDDLNPVLTLDGAIIIGLDSTAPRRAISNGRLYIRQLERSRTLFNDAPEETVRVVVVHHHFVPAPDYRWNQAMQKTQRAINCFVDMGVDLILGGHLHRSYIGNSLNFYPGNHRDRGIIIIQAGTATSSRGIGRERGKNTFNCIDINEGVFQVTHHMFLEDKEKFTPISRHLFPRPGKEFSELKIVST